MLGTHGREIAKAVFTAPARALARVGVTPNQVTIVGTAVTVCAAVGLLGTGRWVSGPIVLGIVLFADSLDGTLARLTGKSSQFGAFLDSTLDRLGDGAVFGAITYAVARQATNSGMQSWLLIAAVVSMVGAATVPYARARAEAVGAEASGGIAERTDRLVIALVAVFCVGIGLPHWILATALSWTALASLITVATRIRSAYRTIENR